MFGLNQIAWEEFSKFLFVVLLTWYGVLIIHGWIKSKQGHGYGSYEEYQSGITSCEALQPIAVLSQDYPSEILPVNLVENLPLLPDSLYEETGYDEGLSIEYFTLRNSPVLAKMITEFHHHQQS